MNQAELIEFLKKNLSLTVSNTCDPWDKHSHIVIDLVLNGENISEIVIDCNDGE